MRHWLLVAILATSLLSTSSKTSAQSRGEGQSALAQQLVATIWSDELKKAEADLVGQLLQTQLMIALAYSGGGPDLHEDQLLSSIRKGSESGLAEVRLAMIATIATSMTDDQLREALAFYRSDDGVQALRARRDDLVRLRAALEAPNSGSADELEFREHTPSSSEAAFVSSSAGKALAAAQAGRNDPDGAQRMIEFVKLDYCAHQRCGKGQKDFFKFIGATFAPDRAKGQHAMWGDTADDLFKKNSPTARLAKAACSGDQRALEAAVKNGANPNAVGKEGVGPGAVRQIVTPLLWAIDCGNIAGIEGLLKLGADPNKAEKFGATPITVAADNKNPAILQTLLAHGGDPNAHNGEMTALAIALGDAVGAVRVDGVPEAKAWAKWDALLAAGADPNRKPPKGRDLMDEAASRGAYEKVEWLYDRGWKGDPILLGRWIEMSEEGPQDGLEANRRAARERVKAKLIARGVRFPIGGLADLKRDGHGFLIQPPAP